MNPALQQFLEDENPRSPDEYTDMQLVEARDSIDQQINQLEAAKKVITDELVDRLKQEKVTGKIVGQFQISRTKRFSFPDVTLEQAKELGAVSETINQTMLKTLWTKGVQLPVKETEYLTFRRKDDA